MKMAVYGSIMMLSVSLAGCTRVPDMEAGTVPVPRGPGIAGGRVELRLLTRIPDSPPPRIHLMLIGRRMEAARWRSPLDWSLADLRLWIRQARPADGGMLSLVITGAEFDNWAEISTGEFLSAVMSLAAIVEEEHDGPGSITIVYRPMR